MMTMKEILQLFKQYTGAEADRIEHIPRSVSARKYFRIFHGEETFIGTYSPDIKETNAFVTFARHFKGKGINVPEIFAVSEDRLYYLQEDLGDRSLHDLVMDIKKEGVIAEAMDYYTQAIDQLVTMQKGGHEGADYSICVPRPAFDRQAILWDLNHFKYYFLKMSGVPFDEQKLEDAFSELADSISGMDSESFMFRDFQTRNIMLKDEQLYFIDFQGGRKGPLHYDLASLVFEARVDMDVEMRSELVHYYMDAIGLKRRADRDLFLQEFYQVAIIRILQALGAYGLRGSIEKNVIFLQSIPIGLKNLHCVLRNVGDDTLPGYLSEILHQLADKKMEYPQPPESFDGLTLSITSFSYRKNIPDDINGNGGGFVFDCRFLDNPHWDEKLKHFNGLDIEIDLFFKERGNMDKFIDQVFAQLSDAARSYKKLGYKNLMVSFGCTGGKHRSVYATRRISDLFREVEDVKVIEKHRELGLNF